MFTPTQTKHGLTHACDGTILEDGSTTAWRLCDGALVAPSAATEAPRPVTCPRCRKLEDAARILALPTLAYGPPDLIGSSWPGARRSGPRYGAK